MRMNQRIMKLKMAMILRVMAQTLFFLSASESPLISASCAYSVQKTCQHSCLAGAPLLTKHWKGSNAWMESHITKRDYKPFKYSGITLVIIYVHCALFPNGQRFVQWLPRCFLTLSGIVALWRTTKWRQASTLTNIGGNKLGKNTKRAQRLHKTIGQS